jgi:diguanylate cyclase (GGDEF)-like protein
MSRSGLTGIRMAAILGPVLGAAVVCTALWQWSALSRHNTIQRLEELPIHSAVRLVGIVTYADEPGNRFWVQDETGALPIPVNPTQAGVQAGETVSIDAIKTARYDRRRGPASVDLRHIRIHPTTAHVRLPQPSPITLGNFPTMEKNGVRIEVTAVVHAAALDGNGRAHLAVSDGGPEVELIVAKPQSDDSNLINSRIRVLGLPEQQRTPQGAVVRDQIWVATGRDLRMEAPAPGVLPLYSVRTLYTDKKARNGHRIRIRGQVAAATPNSILLEDRWGATECILAVRQQFRTGTDVEVEGFPSREGLHIDLHYATVTAETWNLNDSGASFAPLTSVSAVHQLASSRAEQALPVRITGVITYIDQPRRQLFLQDPSGGIYVSYSGDHPEVSVGSRVTLTGITGPGDYAPVILAPKFSGQGIAPMPAAVQVTMEKATSGALDSQYVSIEGVVHPMKVGEESNHPAIAFELLTPVGQVHVYTSSYFPGIDEARSLEDARVRIRGAFGTVFNSRRQLVGYQLLVEKRSDIDVIEPAVASPFGMETTPIGSLLRYSPNARFGHRVKVEGTVTLIEPDFLYMEDAGDGVEVRGDTHSIHVGDVVDAIGYPTLVGRYSPILTDAIFGPRDREGYVAPRNVTAESLLQGREDSMLVTVDGKLLAVLDGPARRNLVLQSGVRTFTAQLDTSDLGIDPWHLREGSVLRLTGVSSAQVDPGRLYRILEEDPASFQILLRSPKDVAVIRRAPFWTPGATAALLATLFVMILAILAWVSALRRRVRAQMAALRKASETAQAVKDLSVAMEHVSSEQQFDTPVSVRGSEEIAHLVVGFNNMLSELRHRDRAKREAESQLQHMALIDDLTGLPNRRLLADRLSQNLAKAKRENRMVALLYIDLDGFKLVNDSLGHGVGDVLLGQVAGRLKARFRQSDTLARIGGDEFTLILDHIQTQSDADMAAESVLEVLKRPFEIEGHTISMTASIGISIFPDHGDESGQLLQQADCAMFAAKKGGKNQIVQFGDDLGNAVRERLTLEGDLRRAIEAKEIMVHYQPEFDLETNRIVRFEALARWTHPKLGSIAPLNFIPIAEESGLIVPLGALVMEKACTDAMTWQRRAKRPIQVAVNVSSVQFARDTFVEEVDAVLGRTGLKPTLLQLELTESVTLSGVERAAETMRRLKAKGISVVMDDFGTGYSCLSYLPKLPFDALKLDRSFVNELVVRPETRAFVQSILTMAHNLRMKVIVEGIETEEQLEMMRSLGTNEAQGYLLGRPSPNPMEQLSWAADIAERTRALASVVLPLLGLGLLATTLGHASAVSKRDTTIQGLQSVPVRTVVHLTGIVTYVDQPGNLLWIQDQTGAMPITVKPLPKGVSAGQTISVEATKAAANLGATKVDLERVRVSVAADAAVAPSFAAHAIPGASEALSLQRHPPADLMMVRGVPVWTPPPVPAMVVVFSLMIFATLLWIYILRRRVRQQREALTRARETTQAIRDLSSAMMLVTAQQQFDSQVSVQGSEDIAELVMGFNTMLHELRRRERARKEAESRLQHMALIDDLTGLPNRRLLADRLSQDLAKARRENQKVGLLYIDLDGFKLVNDSQGHRLGDVLLGQVAQRLRSRFRKSDTLARIGGDEFALVLGHLQNRSDADRAAEDVLEVLKSPFDIEGNAVRISASIGISIFPDHGHEGSQLLQQADTAMFAAKRNGKNCVVQFGDGLGSAARERLTMEGELRQAIEAGQITVHYQPEFDLETNQVVRFEALARWIHPRLGPIPPLSFIPVAEESGLIVPLGAYVMERACAEAAMWQRRANRPIQVAVNVSSVQFARDSFIEEVEEVLFRTGLRPSLLQLEITESATLTGVERAADFIRRLTGKGIGVAMDDFGTGYSCLAYLPKMGFDALKLDRSFVSELVVRPETRPFVQSIIIMAHNLHMKVIVEGIETREQLELMRALGTDEAQGYLLGRPSPNPMEQLSWGADIAVRSREIEVVS